MFTIIVAISPLNLYHPRIRGAGKRGRNNFNFGKTRKKLEAVQCRGLCSQAQSNQSDNDIIGLHVTSQRQGTCHTFLHSVLEGPPAICSGAPPASFEFETRPLSAFSSAFSQLGSIDAESHTRNLGSRPFVRTPHTSSTSRFCMRYIGHVMSGVATPRI